jgi:hypothetical protein
VRRLWWLAGLGTASATHLLHAHAAYCAGLVALSRLAPRRRPSTPAPTELPRIVVLVPAHDEEAVIGPLIRTLLADDYPRERLRIIVIADRCHDATARVAREAGAEVYERSGGAPGKSAAIADALAARVEACEADAIAVFDADNRVAPGFFRAMAGRLADGEDFVQGRVDPSNPVRSWVTASSALGFYAIAGLVQEPRERLGLSSPVMGTGWVARLHPSRSLLDSLTTLTDDLELACLLTCAGVRVAYEETAVVLDEKPADLGVALAQRKRWMQGRWAVASRHVPALVRRVFTGALPAADRARALDQLVQLLGPSLLFSSVALGTLGLLDAAVRPWAPGSFAKAPRPHPNATMLAAVAYYLLPVPFIARLSPPRELWRFYATQPAYLLLSSPLAIVGFFSRRSSRWVRTARDPGSRTPAPTPTHAARRAAPDPSTTHERRPPRR